MPDTPKTKSAHLVDGQADPAVLVPAMVITDFPAASLEEVEKSWRPERELAARELSGAGSDAEHEHWDWRLKAESVESGRHRLVAIECGGAIQGLMAVLRKSRFAVLDPKGEPILYVDYLESAPWNLKRPTKQSRYLGVGTRMIAEAILLSLELGWEGRIGLHSLPQADRFYRNNCGMTDLGPDSDYYDLRYFEYNGERAMMWLYAIGI